MVDAIAASVIARRAGLDGPVHGDRHRVLSMPFTFFISNDAFYFGILPILAKAAARLRHHAGRDRRAPR